MVTPAAWLTLTQPLRQTCASMHEDSVSPADSHNAPPRYWVTRRTKYICQLWAPSSVTWAATTALIATLQVGSVGVGSRQW